MKKIYETPNVVITAFDATDNTNINYAAGPSNVGAPSSNNVKSVTLK